MRCSFDKNLLQEYIENTIEPLEAIILEEHLKVCSDCRRDLTELKLLFWELAEIPMVDLPPEALKVKDNVLQEIKNIDSTNQNRQSFSMEAFVSIQNNIIYNSTLFLQFLPGRKMIAKASKSSMKRTPSIGNFIMESFKTKPKISLLRNSL